MGEEGRSRKRRSSPSPSPSRNRGASSEEEEERRRRRSGKSRSHKADGERASRKEGKKSRREEEKEKSRKGTEKSRKRSREDRDEKKRKKKKKKSREKDNHKSSGGKASDSINMSGGSTHGSGDSSRPRRQRTTSQSVPTLPSPQASTSGFTSSTAVACPSSTPTWGRGHGRRGPTRGLTDRRLEAGQQWDVQVVGGTGIGDAGVSFVSRMGIISKLHCKIWQKDFVNLPPETIAAIFRDLQLTHRWTRTPTTDRDMLMHMSAMHRSWRGVLKKRHYKGKSLEDAITSVPAAVDPADWRTMCEKWNTSDEQIIADRNSANRSHQSMTYRRGRTSHYQLKDDFRRAHERDPDRLELFKMGRCKQLPDGTDHWVDEESRSRYERMTQLTTPSLASESESTPISPEDAFISVMGKDRSGRVRCGGSRETLHTWYGVGEGSSSTMYQQQIQTMEDKLRLQGEEMEQLRIQVDEMRSQQSRMEAQQSRMEALQRQVDQMEHWRRQMDQTRQHQLQMDDMRAQMNAFMSQFQTSQGGVQQPPIVGSEYDSDHNIDEDGDDFDD